jgi:hypothetical protein
VLSPAQRKAAGIEGAASPETEAMWSSDPRHEQWAKEQQERVLREAEWASPLQLERLVDETRGVLDS